MADPYNARPSRDPARCLLTLWFNARSVSTLYSMALSDLNECAPRQTPGFSNYYGRGLKALSNTFIKTFIKYTGPLLHTVQAGLQRCFTSNFWDV